jgi:hypothetical protein
VLLHLKSHKSPFHSIILKLGAKIELLLFYQRSIYISNLSAFRLSYVRFGTRFLANFWRSWPSSKKCGSTRPDLIKRIRKLWDHIPASRVGVTHAAGFGHAARITRVCCPELGNLLTMSSLSGFLQEPLSSAFRAFVSRLQNQPPVSTFKQRRFCVTDATGLHISLVLYVSAVPKWSIS